MTMETPAEDGAEPGAGAAPPPASHPDPATTPTEPEYNLPFPLQDSERVLQLVRKHWIKLWPMTVLYVAIAMVPPVVVIWIFSASDWLDGTTRTVVLIVAAVWIAYWGIRALLNWYRYHNDIWTVTNQRIVDSYRSTPFNLRIVTADLVNIQDMSVQRSGPLQTMLNYGDVVCDTAGGAKNQQFVLSGIPNPQNVQLLVDKERDRERMRRV